METSCSLLRLRGGVGYILNHSAAPAPVAMVTSRGSRLSLL